MGQKASPVGFRLVVRKDWSAVWFADKRAYGQLLAEDRRIRRYLLAKPSCAGAAKIAIARMSDQVKVVIHTPRPGLVIGRKGAEIDLLQEGLQQHIGKRVSIDVEEIKRPDLDARLVAKEIARQLEKRLPFRRVMKKMLSSAIDAGAVGIKIEVSGRLSGAEIARSEWYKKGKIPLSTLRAEIGYSQESVRTTYGLLGVKVWIHLGQQRV